MIDSNICKKFVSGKETQPRNKFMNWIQTCKSMSSNNGFTVNDLDSVIFNFKSQKIIFLETKCYNCEPTISQIKIFNEIHNNFSVSKKFVGCFLFQFSHESPTDGSILISKFENGSYHEIKRICSSEDSGDRLEKWIHDLLV